MGETALRFVSIRFDSTMLISHPPHTNRIDSNQSKTNRRERERQKIRINKYWGSSVQPTATASKTRQWIQWNHFYNLIIAIRNGIFLFFFDFYFFDSSSIEYRQFRQCPFRVHAPRSNNMGHGLMADRSAVCVSADSMTFDFVRSRKRIHRYQRFASNRMQQSRARTSHSEENASFAPSHCYRIS